MSSRSITEIANETLFDKLSARSLKDIERVTKQVQGWAVSPLLTVALAVVTRTVGQEQWHAGSTAIVDRATPSNANFDTVLERVANLVQEAEEDGAVSPSDHAMAETRRLLRATFSSIDFIFPRASAMSDGRGWVHLYWRKADRMVQLVVPADSSQLAYIYHSDGEDYDVDPGVTASKLLLWLDWFANA